ncbi:MAG: peptide-methionine (R)-S-oxide reductase MsrB [Candidatus Sungbacteria bacterium]|nr:peptide-methionine (R)-S-oxide reductase MsrB [Candidatus Sungbacteria bacterium]
MDTKAIPKTEEEWKRKLTPEQYRVLREKGTEAPFTGKYSHEERTGMYACAACGNPLFSSDTKFDSGTGWPSFDQALPGAVKSVSDTTHGMERTEVVCTKCGSHLGHLFDDLPRGKAGSPRTGKRYCMNSVCLELNPPHASGS